jgi:hypothetical protein
MAVLMLATILGSYHSHAYGPLLLVMPVAAMLAASRVSRVTGLLLLGAAVLPLLLWVTMFKWYIVTLSVLLVASFGALLYELWAHERRRDGDAAATITQERVSVTRSS